MNIKANKQLIDYLTKCVNANKLVDEVKKNRLESVFETEYRNEKYINHKEKRILQIRFWCMQKELEKVCDLFNFYKIEYCTFKGVILSKQLYGDDDTRRMGDIDILVKKTYFDFALNILRQNGYEMHDCENKNPEHHIILKKASITLELHKNFLNPLIGINESFLLDNVVIKSFVQVKCLSFSITATLLHLLYHLYMDLMIGSDNCYKLFTQNTYDYTNGFLAHAYEIALFSELYMNDIEWENIISDLSRQNLSITFWKMCIDILNIFPNSLPDFVVEFINDFKYYSTESNDFYNFFKANYYKTNKLCMCTEENILGQYIDKKWSENFLVLYSKKINIAKDNDVIFYDKNKKKHNNLLKKLIFNSNLKGLLITFFVNDANLCITSRYNYDTLKSDGIHLLICNSIHYVYDSIFLFPKNQNGKIVIIPIDVIKNKEITKKEINCSFYRYNNSYALKVLLTPNFFVRRYITNSFYFNFIISNCDSNKKIRVNEYRLVQEGYWFNPVNYYKLFF